MPCPESGPAAVSLKKRSFALVLVALFVAGQTFAAQPVSVKSQTAQGSGGTGSMTNTIMETKIDNSNVISTGGGKTNIGTIKNQ